MKKIFAIALILMVALYCLDVVDAGEPYPKEPKPKEPKPKGPKAKGPPKGKKGPGPQIG